MGEVDSYLVTLSDHDRKLHTVSVSRSSPECVFNSLVSGRLYNISISSRSGLFYNHTLVQERTRESSTASSETPVAPPEMLRRGVGVMGTLQILGWPTKIKSHHFRMS